MKLGSPHITIVIKRHHAWQFLIKSILAVTCKTKNSSSFDTTIPHLCTYPREMKIYILKRTFSSSSLHHYQKVKAAHMSTERRLDEQMVVYLYNEAILRLFLITNMHNNTN
jgi:hypothetical protein